MAVENGYMGFEKEDLTIVATDLTFQRFLGLHRELGTSNEDQVRRAEAFISDNFKTIAEALSERSEEFAKVATQIALEQSFYTTG